MQVAVLEDGIIQQIIIPHDMIDQMEDKINQGGHYIGTYVLAGFLSPNSSASKADVKQFDLGVQQGDLSNIDINEGGFLTQKYKYDYFFFISTLALGYVFYYMLKYCIDIAGRCFRLLLYKLIAPIAMIEYMINGSQDGVFKQWLSATISTYAMLFVRILAIWFVLLVTTLMGDESGAYAGELLTSNDYFLRAIIIIALLGFMMDLPKLVGQIFGLDLEQEGSASGVLKQVGGMVKGAAVAGLAVGGAAAAGGYSMAKGGLQNLQSAGNKAGGLRNLAKNTGKNIGAGIGNMASNIKNNPKGALKSLTPGNVMKKANQMSGNLSQSEFGQQMDRTGKAVFGAVMATNQFTKSAYGGYEEVRGEESKARAKEKEAARHAEITGNQEKQMDQEKVITVTTRLADSGMDYGVAEVAARVRPTEVAACDAQLQGSIATVAAATIAASDVQADGSISLSAQAPLRREVEEVVKRTYESQGVDTSLPTVQQTISQQVDQVLGSAVASVDQTGKVTLSVDTSSISTSAVGMGDQTITQVVNQVQGTKVGAETLEQTKIINEQLGTIVSNTGTTAEQVTRSVEVQEDIQYNVKAQTNIQRNQVSMVDDIRENTIPTRSDREIPDHLDEGSGWDV